MLCNLGTDVTDVTVILKKVTRTYEHMCAYVRN